jgi:hypothetical protein
MQNVAAADAGLPEFTANRAASEPRRRKKPSNDADFPLAPALPFPWTNTVRHHRDRG